MLSNERIIRWPYLIFGLIDELGQKCFFILDPKWAEEQPHQNTQFPHFKYIGYVYIKSMMGQVTFI